MWGVKILNKKTARKLQENYKKTVQYNLQYNPDIHNSEIHYPKKKVYNLKILLFHLDIKVIIILIFFFGKNKIINIFLSDNLSL